MKILFSAVSIVLLFSCVGYTPNEDVGEVYYNLGNAYLELERHQDAIKAYSIALDYSKNFELARYNLARTYALRTEYDLALKSTNELLDSDPDSLLFRELKAWILYLQKKYGESINIYNEILEIDPIRETSLFNLALLYYGQSEYALALEQFKRLAREYDQSEYDYWLGASYFNTEDYKNAGEVLAGITSSELESEELEQFYFYLGYSLEQQLMFSEAISAYREGQSLGEGNAAAAFFFHEGRLQWNILENQEKAQELFDTAIENGFNDVHAVKKFIKDENTVDTEELETYFMNVSLYSKEPDTDHDNNVDAENSD